MEKENSQLKLSDACIARLKEITNNKNESFLRVTIEGGGCSGFQYKFEMDSVLNEEDR